MANKPNPDSVSSHVLKILTEYGRDVSPKLVYEKVKNMGRNREKWLTYATVARLVCRKRKN